MADVAMGQALNTVTCPVCSYSSRNFDPFNLLSIPIPTIADAVFQCTVVRRSTPRNCPWILNKPAKGDTRPNRFLEQLDDKNSQLQPPSEFFSCEQYVIALSRLADGGDLRLQIQNLSGIRADQLRICRAELISVNNNTGDDGVTKRYVKLVPLSDKEGPASQLLKARSPNDESSRLPTQIVAFELSLNPRIIDKVETKQNSIRDTNVMDDDQYPSALEIAEIEQYLAVYGDENECRFVDTHPLVLAKAVSKSLWPRSESELRIGLRVDAQDHRGNWYTGSVVDIFDDEVNGGDADTGQEVAIQQKKVRVHFDNFLPKWDEVYTIEHFKKGRVNPLCSFAEPKMKQTEFIGHHRYTADRSKGQPLLFGQSFFIQCQNEWSNVRAGAHILAQASRFLGQHNESADLIRLFDKVHCSISELIDFLLEIDREYILRALGVSPQSTEERLRPYRNPSFDSATFVTDANKRIATLLNRLPFEIRLCSIEPLNGVNSEEIPFPLVLNKTVGNFVSTRNAIVLHWREPSVEKKSGPALRGIPSILYVEPFVHVHESSAAALRNETTNGETKKPAERSGEIDLQYCLTEFCKVQKLPMSDNWVCPRCKVIREGGQNMNLWRIPDLLTFHIKRFNMSARWHEKITTKVNFPMTGLDLSEWCHPESPVLQDKATKDASCIYDLIGVMNHYGSLTGGHYVATCKATLCGRDGKEEVAYSFNGVGSRGNGPEPLESASEEPSSSWVGLGRPKQQKVQQSRLDAALASKAVAESAEPMWLQFDDEVVEAIPPRLVVSEMAYVLFYRKRHLTSSNIAKYSTFE
jgi:Ubiquitin carboxyl-terminal hydrolase